MDQIQLSSMESVKRKNTQAVQPPVVDQIQLSSIESVKRKNTPQEENPGSESIQRMFIRRSFDVIKDVTGIFQSPMGIVYMILFMMMFNVGISRAASIPGQDNFLSTNAFSRLQPDQNMIIFDATSIDTKDFLFDLGEVNNGIHTGINSSCITIRAMNKQCALHPENCQAAELAVMNLESSIEKYLQTKYALQRVCNAGEVPSSKEVIRRCHADEDWEGQFRGKRYIPSRAIPSGTSTPENDFTLSEEHLDQDSMLERVRRFVISRAILIATAFGVTGLATAAGTAHVIANNQARKVLKKVQNHRAEDIQNNRDTEGLTRGEVGQKTRASADVTTVTTFIIPTKSNSAKCEDRMILKTLFVPVINHRSRRVVVTEGGKIFPKFGDKSRYILLSRNSLLSKETKLFDPAPSTIQ